MFHIKQYACIKIKVEGIQVNMDNTIELKDIVDRQRNFFNTDKTKSVEYRIDMLNRLKKAINDNENLVIKALYDDLSKSEAEAYMTEIAIAYEEINIALKNIGKWSKPQKVKGTLGTFPAKSYIYSEPYGVVLIMSPWNYPFNLTINPLTAAIAAGNCVIIKCSEDSGQTSKIIEKIIKETFEDDYIFCVTDNVDYDELINQRYDYIFYTGSPRIGKIIMRAASENLTPVSLELGGKSPCIVDETADIELAAKRIAWGKLLNAGQTCVSVDYVVVHSGVKEKFLGALQKEINLRYPDAPNNENYPRIINNRHYERLANLIKTEKNVIGGQKNDEKLKISPTIFPNIDFDHEIMAEEIFGPLLPVIEYNDINKVIHTIKEREKPLACYVFTQNRELANHVINSLSYGGGCINDVIIHITNSNMPFGGVGYSGMGAYHGKYGFETFSHKKGIIKNTSLFDLPFRYAPFDKDKLKILKRLM